ncbi:MAG: DEAD/DEAH box helicase [Candidatus Thorarchaeota archaeon]
MGISKLFPPQKSAFDTDVLNGSNLVLAIPTSSGKTLVAEICMLKAILDGKGKALYLVPLKSLAREKFNDFRKYNSLGITTSMSVGDYDSPGTRLNDADIVVLTTERADSLIRHRASWLQDIAVIVVDEVHLVNDQSRGPTLEMVLAKMIQIIPDVQIVALSATISNADEIAGWLDAELVKSSWRPVPLNEGVSLDGRISFSDGSSRNVNRTRREEITDVVCDILDENGQVLIFVSSRRSTVVVAKKIAASIRPYISQESLAELSKIADKIGSGHSAPEASKTLSRVLRQGIAFHHAGLDNQERVLVEDAFRNNHLKVITATPTLAAGVNLPARRVIIRDYRRFEQGRGSYPIPILEYKQMAGRAGRPKYDKYGEAVLMAKSEQELEFLIDRYLLSESEIITSKLASQSAIQSHILSSIAADMTSTREEIDELIAGTFFSFQFNPQDIEHHVSAALHYLHEGELIDKGADGKLTATPLGRRTSQLYVDPRTAVLLRDVLSEAEEATEIGLLHLICSTVDQPVTYVTQSEFGDYEFFIEDHYKELMTEPPDSWEEPEKYTAFLAQIKTARLLEDWVDESSEKSITDEYNVGMGDIHRYVQSAKWLLYAASEVAKITGADNHIGLLHQLQTRMQHGVKSELLELVGLRGIGRIRGRMLYSHGLKTLSDLYHVPIAELGQVPTIGTAVAVSVKQQLGIEVSDIPRSDSVEGPESKSSDPTQMLLADFDTSDS